MKKRSQAIWVILILALTVTNLSRVYAQDEGEGDGETSSSDSSETSSEETAQNTRPKRPDPRLKPQGGFKPAVLAQFSDGGQLRSFWNENAWMREFAASDLSAGVFRRISPLLLSLPDPSEKSWKGRLIDALAGEFLDKRLVKLSWFSRAELVSPFGMSFQAQGLVESALLKALIAAYGSKPLDVEVSRIAPSRERASESNVTVKLEPVVFRGQVFALGMDSGSGCVSLSRDPKISAWHLLECQDSAGALASGAPRPSAALLERAKAGWVRFDLDEWYPQGAVPLRLLINSSQALFFGLNWNGDQKKYQISGVELPAEDSKRTSVLKAASGVEEALLKAIPADADLFAALTVALPRGGDIDKISQDLDSWSKSGPPANSAGALIALVGYGMEFLSNSKESWSVRDGSVLLVLPRGKTALNPMQLAKLYAPSDSSAVEVFTRAVCGTVIALSASKKSLDQVEKSCAGKIPSVANWSDSLKSQVSNKERGAVIYWSPASLFENWMRLGLKIDATDAQDPELKSSFELFKKISPIAWVGSSSAQGTLLLEVKP